VAPTRRRFPAGAILSGSSEKAHAKPRAPAAQDLTEGRRCQRRPHRIVDDKASGGGGSKNLSRAVPFQHAGLHLRRFGWTHQKPEQRALERSDKAIERWKREKWPEVKKTPRGCVPT